MKVNACGCYSLSVSSVHLTQFEDWDGTSGAIITYHNSQPPAHHIPQIPTPRSSYTTTSNPQLIIYHNPTPKSSHTTTHNHHPPPHCMPQLRTPNSSHIATSTPQFIPYHNPQPGGADTSLCLTALHPTSTAYEFTDNEMVCCCTFVMPATRCCSSICSWATEGFHSNFLL